MIEDFLFNWIKKQKYGITVYPADLFELRIQEEMIRTDEAHGFFVYIEVSFVKVRETLKDENAEYDFWKAFLKSLATKNRGSDSYGLLQGNSGIGLLLLDSEMQGWYRLKGRIQEFCRLTIGDVSETLNQGIKAFVYPACLARPEKSPTP